MEKVKRKFGFKNLVGYLALFFACLVFANAKVYGISPFLFAFYFACVYVGVDEKLMAAFTLGSQLIVDFSLQSFLIAITVVTVGLINFYVHRLAKKSIKLGTNFCLYFVSLVTYIYYNYAHIWQLCAYLVFGAISLFAFTTVCQVMILRRNCFKLTLDESICFLFSVAVLGLGVAPVNIYGFELYKLVATLCIVISVGIGNPMLTFALSLSFNLGVSISLSSLLPIAEFSIISLLASMFSMPNKFKIAISSFIGAAFVELFFLGANLDVVYSLLPILSGLVVFVAIPSKGINGLADLVYVKRSELTSRNLVNTTRRSIHKRMSELSNIFMEMKQIHLNMIKKDLTHDELVTMLVREVTSTCCKECLDKNRCTRSLGTDNRSSLESLIEVALKKGKVSLLDLPAGLTNRCAKVNNLISLVNRLTDEYRQYKGMVADVNNVKYLLADQMGAVSQLLLNIGDEIDTNVTFDVARENKIITRLLNHNVECKEVLIYAEKNQDISAILIVKNGEKDLDFIQKVTTEVLKTPMQISLIKPMEETGFNSITLRRQSKYDCAFGLASCCKAGNDECGDCHSIIRLGKDKFLLALCDGMGAGMAAHKMSAMTLSLIENFYKVGFENDIILESVNKLLAINNQENYSTLDVCLLDLDSQLADFIKVGAPYGIIKHSDGLEVVEGGALPIGALDNINPSIYKTAVTTKDIVILATDGITDAFKTIEEYKDFVSHLVSTNPQVLAETILNEAVRLNDNSAKDDMTVLVARTFLKN
mgnify:CR=1 FL=1